MKNTFRFFKCFCVAIFLFNCLLFISKHEACAELFLETTCNIAERSYSYILGKESLETEGMRTFLTKIDEEIIYDSDRAMSKHILGMAYLTGTYKDKDCRKADLWFNEACKTGLKHGCESRDKIHQLAKEIIPLGGSVYIDGGYHQCTW